jgi:hypothetical protein
MDLDAITVTLDFHSVTAGNEPLGQSVELSLRADGFHDPRGLGGSGEAARPLGADEAADMLGTLFDRRDLARLLGYVEALRAALERSP